MTHIEHINIKQELVYILLLENGNVHGYYVTRQLEPDGCPSTGEHNRMTQVRVGHTLWIDDINVPGDGLDEFVADWFHQPNTNYRMMQVDDFSTVVCLFLKRKQLTLSATKLSRNS